MKKVICAMCLATVFGAAAGLSAQSDPMAKDQMGKKDMTVSGCVTAGTGAGQFMLTNAMMAAGGGMDKGKMKPGMADDHMMMSYELVGGKDLKAHVGHKVEVTGNLSKADMDHMAKMDKTEKDKMMADKNMKAMKLNVTSFKMVSANCS